MDTPENVAALVDEYKIILEQATAVSARHISHDSDKVERLLVSEGEWTPRAAEHLLHLSKAYGSFMLRNALALALALEIEDGALDF